jgi:hypothetical protein
MSALAAAEAALPSPPTASPVYLLYTDETNTEPEGDSEFFIYGGVLLQVGQLRSVHNAVRDIRVSHGFAPTDVFKFHSRSRPQSVSQDQHLAAKSELLAACAECGVRFVACAILHSIATHPDKRWANQADMVLLAFDSVLNEEGATGIVVVDRTTDGFDYLREKFQKGIVYSKSGGTYRMSDRMNLFAQGCIGSSHLASVVDIVLGAFRYCVNDREGKAATKAMLPAVLRLMPFRTWKGKTIYLDYGLLLRPRRVIVPSYKAKYDELVGRLNAAMAAVGGEASTFMSWEQVYQEMARAENG